MPGDGHLDWLAASHGDFSTELTERTIILEEVERFAI
jgi:hypothetical protein